MLQGHQEQHGQHNRLQCEGGPDRQQVGAAVGVVVVALVAAVVVVVVWGEVVAAWVGRALMAAV